MKLLDLMGKTLSQLTEEDMEVVEFKPHANDVGDVMSVEIKLVPTDQLNKPNIPSGPQFRRYT